MTANLSVKLSSDFHDCCVFEDIVNAWLRGGEGRNIVRGCVGAGIKAEVEDEGEFAFFCFMDEFI